MAVIGSYTLYSNYETCPRQCYHLRIAKDVKREETDALKKGIAAHEALEARVGKGAPLPDEWESAESMCVTLDAFKRSCTIVAEQKLGVTADVKACGFFDKNVWFRGKADVVVMHPEGAWLVDWKTGNPNYEDPFELGLQAMMLWAKYPNLRRIEGGYFWLRTGKLGQNYILSPPAEWRKRATQISGEIEKSVAEHHWPARPNPFCKGCAVTICEHRR